MTAMHCDEPSWRARQRAHRERVARWTQPHRQRRRHGLKHPVLDFLFTYYGFRPSLLERWHPGPGVVLGGQADEFLRWPGYLRVEAGVCFDPASLPAGRRANAEFVRTLLRATETRRPQLGCFGLHEWAMVYRTDAPRHQQLPLRLGEAGTNAVVETHALRCTHHDAFRFFTDSARPRNAIALTRTDQLAFEQPGCLHTTMDLYKWAYKLAPATPSELVADCFELAMEVRELDMRASPYDLSSLGYPPVCVETAAGRAEYARIQARFAARAQPLRARLIEIAEQVAAPAQPIPVSITDSVLPGAESMPALVI
ncbi:MAG: 3-methyladenine DNA glycosylase [Pseudonocardia sp.]|nr:3-methyladenine DNA glycosylase [Pseudonocardia sp.]